MLSTHGITKALFLTFDYIVGGWNSPDIVVGPGQGHFLYILGLVIVAAYVPLYWWRRISDQRRGIAPSDEMPLVLGSPGGIDLGESSEPVVVSPSAMPTMSAMQAETER